jgi:hypothetical protein
MHPLAPPDTTRNMRICPTSSLLPTLLLLLLAGGCARYEYQLVRPPELTRHIGRGADAVFTLEPLEYRLRTVDNRLVMRVFNPTEDPIQLIGAQSTVVDPNGQSHPLPGQTIAPSSFIKMIFPPPRPRVHDPYGGPTFHTGFGVGVRVDSGARRRGRPGRSSAVYASSTAVTPRYLQVYGDPHFFWDWRGEGEARIILVYRRGDDEFRHEFLFRRKKV